MRVKNPAYVTRDKLKCQDKFWGKEEGIKMQDTKKCNWRYRSICFCIQVNVDQGVDRNASTFLLCGRGTPISINTQINHNLSVLRAFKPAGPR